MSYNTSNLRQLQQQESLPIYTHQLPYGIRRRFCNILDADCSWRRLGGQYIGLDDTDLTLIGQAQMRPLGSPTEELLSKLDSRNFRVAILCDYLRDMNHHRALEMLNSSSGNLSNAVNQRNNGDMIITTSDTLNTPTHSFVEQDSHRNQQHQQQQQQLMALMGGEFDYQQHPFYDQQQVILKEQNRYNQSNPQKQLQQQQQQPVRCHRNETEAPQDPGEEIVRMACATNRNRTSISDQEVVNQLRLIMQINYNELKLASNDFSDLNILGNGGFASVYRGNWKGTNVAIKRLKCNLMDQALNELTILNSYRIDNILPIYGISIDGPEACLVYQFMSNGSLEDRLSCKKDTKPLSWTQRALIGEGVAKGLYYLHTLRDKPLVHGDVKSANVLLDSQFVPKLGDFGLARQVFKGKNPQTGLCTHCTVSSIHGTSVYLPPEYLRHKILSPAVDVYSYGIVLLEMATGKRAYDGRRLLIDLVEDGTQSIDEGEINSSLKDSRLSNDTDNDLKIWYELLIKLGLNCAHKIKKKRPDMGNVLGKFVEFRNVNPINQQNDRDLNATSSTLTTNNTAAINRNHQTNNNNVAGLSGRTLTPDLSALIGHQHPLKNNLQQPQQISSNLMSVEELHEPQPTGNGHQQQVDAVNAMIPLITELGLRPHEA